MTVFRRNGELRLSGIAEIIAQLDAGRPALVLLMLSTSFDLAGPDGIVRAPAGEAPDRTRRHAMVAVGHGTLNGAPAILVRNSWGDGWGQAGHGWLPEAYLAPRLTAVALLTENIDVLAKDSRGLTAPRPGSLLRRRSMHSRSTKPTTS